MDKDTFVKLYATNVRPKLKYATQVWSLHLRKMKGMIEKVQRRVS